MCWNWLLIKLFGDCLAKLWDDMFGFSSSLVCTILTIHRLMDYCPASQQVQHFHFATPLHSTRDRGKDLLLDLMVAFIIQFASHRDAQID